MLGSLIVVLFIFFVWCVIFRCLLPCFLPSEAWSHAIIFMLFMHGKYSWFICFTYPQLILRVKFVGYRMPDMTIVTLFLFFSIFNVHLSTNNKHRRPQKNRRAARSYLWSLSLCLQSDSWRVYCEIQLHVTDGGTTPILCSLCMSSPRARTTPVSAWWHLCAMLRQTQRK